MEEKRKNKTILTICYLIFCILLVVLIAFFVLDCIDYSKGIKTEAKVTEVIHKRAKNGNGKSSKRTILHIDYEADNENYSTTVYLSGNKLYSINDTITVSYDPGDPQKICAKNRLFQEFRVLLYYSLFVIIMIALLIRSKRDSSRRKVIE